MVLQSDIEGFDDMLLDAVIHEAENEPEQKGKFNRKHKKI